MKGAWVFGSTITAEEMNSYFLDPAKKHKHKLRYVGKSHWTRAWFPVYFHCFICRHSFAKDSLFKKLRDLGREAV